MIWKGTRMLPQKRKQWEGKYTTVLHPSSIERLQFRTKQTMSSKTD